MLWSFAQRASGKHARGDFAAGSLLEFLDHGFPNGFDFITYRNMPRAEANATLRVCQLMWTQPSGQGETARSRGLQKIPSRNAVVIKHGLLLLFVRVFLEPEPVPGEGDARNTERFCNLSF
jgi:hypothetical protein